MNDNGRGLILRVILMAMSKMSMLLSVCLSHFQNLQYMHLKNLYLEMHKMSVSEHVWHDGSMTYVKGRWCVSYIYLRPAGTGTPLRGVSIKRSSVSVERPGYQFAVLGN